MIRSSLILLGAVGLLMGTGQNAPPPDPPPAEPTRDVEAPPPDGLPPDVLIPEYAPGEEPRVIVRLDRRVEIQGHLLLATDDVVVMRSLDGEVMSFPSSRIAKLVRLTDPEPEQRGVVHMKNGERRAGVVISDDYDLVVVSIEGVRLELPREIVDEVRLAPTFDELYAHFRATLDPAVPERHFALCDWLAREKRWDLASTELNALLASKPTYARAIKLKRMVDAQLSLRRSAPATGARESGSREPERVRRRDHDFTITDADVNIIRVYEIDFARPPRVVVSRDAIARLLERYSSDELMPESQSERLKLYRADSLDVARFMFDLRARDLYGDIDVMTEPPSLKMYRERVHDTWLIQNCATSRCHGGPGMPFQLNREWSRDPRTRYANLLTLERYPPIDAKPIIDWSTPEHSLAYQYALPRHLAKYPHPEVEGWSAAFRNHKDRLAVDTVQWIRSMMQPRPDYPVSFDPLQPRKQDLEEPPAADPTDEPIRKRADRS